MEIFGQVQQRVVLLGVENDRLHGIIDENFKQIEQLKLRNNSMEEFHDNEMLRLEED